MLHVLMRFITVVELEVVIQARIELRNRFIVLHIHILVLDRPPQSLNENVVEHAPAPIPADEHLCCFKTSRESYGRKLDALIRTAPLACSQTYYTKHLDHCRYRFVRQGLGPFQVLRELPTL